jgi:hypothetical protein
LGAVRRGRGRKRLVAAGCNQDRFVTEDWQYSSIKIGGCVCTFLNPALRRNSTQCPIGVGFGFRVSGRRWAVLATATCQRRTGPATCGSRGLVRLMRSFPERSAPGARPETFYSIKVEKLSRRGRGFLRGNRTRGSRRTLAARNPTRSVRVRQFEALGQRQPRHCSPVSQGSHESQRSACQHWLQSNSAASD